MSESFNSKPEPLSAKSKWHYDSYYVLQLERLNIRQPIHTTPKTVNLSQESEQQISKRNEVIKRIYELAASIGVSVTIIENPRLAT